MSYIVFDLETTGLKPEEGAHIIEIAAIKVLDTGEFEEFSVLCNPGILISEKITQITGISNEMVVSSMTEETALRNFIQFCGTPEFMVGHNAFSFDMKFLKFHLESYHIEAPQITSLFVKDTMIIAKQLRQKGLLKTAHPSNSLQNLTNHFGIVNDNPHRALADVYATYRLFEKLKQFK
jgi:DNA polymerase-3 subunit epsilon